MRNTIENATKESGVPNDLYGGQYTCRKEVATTYVDRSGSHSDRDNLSTNEGRGESPRLSKYVLAQLHQSFLHESNRKTHQEEDRNG